MSETCGGGGAHNKTIVLRGTVKPKQTNADRIRAMTDEELANVAAELVDCAENCRARRTGCATSEETCVCAWLDWLKQEVGE